MVEELEREQRSNSSNQTQSIDDISGDVFLSIPMVYEPNYENPVSITHWNQKDKKKLDIVANELVLMENLLKQIQHLVSLILLTNS
jgi:hypothetical protein